MVMESSLFSRNQREIFSFETQESERHENSARETFQGDPPQEHPHATERRNSQDENCKQARLNKEPRHEKSSTADTVVPYDFVYYSRKTTV
jgi:hypothetical protein